MTQVSQYGEQNLRRVLQVSCVVTVKMRRWGLNLLIKNCPRKLWEVCGYWVEKAAPGLKVGMDPRGDSMPVIQIQT